MVAAVRAGAHLRQMARQFGLGLATVQIEPLTSSDHEDLTKEWVTEDGGLETVHDDPRFDALIRRTYKSQ